MRIVRFRDHVAVPRSFVVGVEADHNVDKIKFVLPEFDDSQVAVLYWQNDERSDAEALPDGVLTVVNTMSQYPGVMTCYINITVGERMMWHSEPFEIEIKDIPEYIEEQISQAYPSAIQAGAARAETAAREAEAAQAAAETAQSNAETAQAAAEAAQSNAEAAQAAAETAQSDAETAANESDQHRIGAYGYATEAESHARAAERAATRAESAQMAAMESETNAEIHVDEAAQERVAAETAKTAAENAALEAQDYSTDANGSAIQAEGSAREAAQTAAQIVTDEAARVSVENARVSAEQARVSAEQARVSAEYDRVSAEQARVSAEQARVSAEQARVSAEQVRVSAENARAAAEANREAVINDLLDETEKIKSATVTETLGDEIEYTANEEGGYWRYINGNWTKTKTSGTTYYHMVTYPVTAGEKYRVSGSHLGYCPLATFWTDEGDVPFECTPDGYASSQAKEDITLDVIVPDGATKMIVTQFKLGLFPTVKEITYENSLTNGTKELKREIGELDYGELNDGYFDGNGNIVTTGTNGEVYGEKYIPVCEGQTVTLTIYLSEQKQTWLRICKYDKNKNCVGQYTPSPPVISTKERAESYTVDEGISYIRICFRSFGTYFISATLRYSSLSEAVTELVKASAVSPIRYNPNCLFIAHQGYDPESTGLTSGYCKLEGYYAAAKHGFDAAETDIKFSSGGTPVCCHDSSFTDATTGDEIIIRDTTWSDLQTCDYYGGKIAKFEDVLQACKDTGMLLFIDQLSGASQAELQSVIDIVRRYAMADRVVWIIAPSADTNAQMIKNILPTTGFEILESGAQVSDLISYANSIVTDYNRVYVGVNYANNTVDAIKDFALTLDSRAKMATWTIPSWIPSCRSYMHVCGAVTTNRTCYNDIYNYGLEG